MVHEGWSIYILFQESKKQMCSKNLSLVKKRPPLVNDNEQGPSGGGGGGGGQRKIYNIFIERKDYIFLSCKQIFNC